MLIFSEIKATGRLLSKIHVRIINTGCPLALGEPYVSKKTYGTHSCLYYTYLCVHIDVWRCVQWNVMISFTTDPEEKMLLRAARYKWKRKWNCVCEWSEDHESDLCIKEAIFLWDRKHSMKTGRQEANFRNGILPLVIWCRLGLGRHLNVRVCVSVSYGSFTWA